MYPIRLQMFRQNLESNLGAAKFTPQETHALIEKAISLIAAPEQVFPDAFFNVDGALQSISKERKISLDDAKLALLSDPAILFTKAGLPTRDPNTDITLVSSRRHLGLNGTASKKQIAIPVKLSDEQKRIAAELAAQPRRRTMEELHRDIKQGVNYGPKAAEVRRETRAKDDAAVASRPAKQGTPSAKSVKSETETETETPKKTRKRSRIDEDAVFAAIDQSLGERGNIPGPRDGYKYLPEGHPGWSAVGNYMRTTLKTTPKAFYEKRIAEEIAPMQEELTTEIPSEIPEIVSAPAEPEPVIETPAAPLAQPEEPKADQNKTNNNLFHARDVFADCVRHINQNKSLPQPGVFYHFVCGKGVSAIDRAFKKGSIEGLEHFIQVTDTPPRTTAEFLVAAGIAEKKDGQIIPRPAKFIQQRLSELNIE